MQYLLHQIVSDDVPVDQSYRSLRTLEALSGDRFCRVIFESEFRNLRHHPVVEQVKERQQLRKDGVVVVSRVRDQNIGESAFEGDAGLIGRQHAPYIAEGAWRLRRFHLAEPQSGA